MSDGEGGAEVGDEAAGAVFDQANEPGWQPPVAEAVAALAEELRAGLVAVHERIGVVGAVETRMHARLSALEQRQDRIENLSERVRGVEAGVSEVRRVALSDTDVALLRRLRALMAEWAAGDDDEG